MNQNQRTGSTRIMTAIEPGVIALRYTNRWSAFDRGASEQEIPGIGAARCACAVRSFEIAKDAGLLTHFVRQADDLTIHVLECGVPGQPLLSGRSAGRVLDSEFIFRIKAFGSMLERLNTGKAKPEQFGFAPGTVVTAGMKLPKMHLECTTKFEQVDRNLTDEEARLRNGRTESEWLEVWELVSGAVNVTGDEFATRGFMVPDGKCEVGWLNDGGPMLVDVFGTPDENRIIGTNDELYSKDLIRNHLNKDVAWKAALAAAKHDYPNDKSRWPAYPTLPQSLVDLVSQRYLDVARCYGGVNVMV